MIDLLVGIGSMLIAVTGGCDSPTLSCTPPGPCNIVAKSELCWTPPQDECAGNSNGKITRYFACATQRGVSRGCAEMPRLESKVRECPTESLVLVDTWTNAVPGEPVIIQMYKQVEKLGVGAERTKIDDARIEVVEWP